MITHNLLFISPLFPQLNHLQTKTTREEDKKEIFHQFSYRHSKIVDGSVIINRKYLQLSYHVPQSLQCNI